MADPGERAFAGVRLARLLGVSFAADNGGALPREELFAGWRLFFERLAATGPVVLTSQAQGVPLFAVETVRSLIDRDIVQPVEGVYQLASPGR